MSLVYPASDPDEAAPQVHALVIGVGRYPHLRGGVGRLAKTHFDMGQLPSPPASAQAMANWLIERRTTSHLNPRVPLGTVELLLSPTSYTDPTGRVRDVNEAIFANISAAFKAWRVRCDRHVENIGLFYFCGHGLERESTYLLPSDHGDNEDVPWRNTIDFGLTKTGLECASRARTICWLIDACRNNPIDTMKWPAIKAQPLFDPPLRGDPSRVILDLRPTTRNGVAHGPPGGGVSYFTGELIRCLDSLGASSSALGGRKWCVTTESLRQAMEVLMSRTSLPDGSRGRCDASGSRNTYGQPTILHALPGSAHVLVTITYHPDPALEFASLTVGRDGCALQRRDPVPERWDIELEAARYDIRAHFPRREYPDCELRDQILAPPAVVCELGASDMPTERSEQGLLSLRYGEDMEDPSGPAVPIDIIDEDFQEVPWAPQVLELGKPVGIRVRPGSYLIRAFLPSGEVVSRQARVEPLSETVVWIGPRNPPPRVSLTWAYALRNVSSWGRMSRFVSETESAWTAEGLGVGASGIKMILWSRTSSPADPWQPAGAVEPNRDVSQDDPNALAEATVTVPNGGSWLEVRGPGIPARFVALPPNLSGQTRVLVVADDRSEPAFDPVDVMVGLGDGRAEAILAYLALGALEPARRLGEPLLEQAENQLARGELSPALAAAVGYYLLKASSSDRPHDWTASLASDFPWLADGPIIRAWHLLRRPDPDPAEFRSLLVEATGRGLPLFTQGLRLLHDGLSVAARSWPDDEPTRRGLEVIHPYAAAAKWSALLTTFYGEDPRRPALLLRSSATVTAGGLEHVLECLDRVDSPLYQEMLRSIFSHGATPEEAANELGIRSDPDMLLLEAMRDLSQLVSVS